VDVYTYDLLHIALYPHNTAESCQAFLLALRAKGYRPRVIALVLVDGQVQSLDQHYQNFCDFDSLDSSCLFLAVFEKVYRFTPFTEDAQPHVRGRCPLELAGYDVSRLPMTQVCRGWALSWPTHPDKEVVPHV
jgi:hypothetical protein